MLGLGLSLLTGGALRPYYAVVAAAFKDRVEADGGTVESMSCLKADLKVLNPVKPPAFTGLLNDYSGAAAAYSLRLLDNTYTGDAIVVTTNGSDSASIGFVNNELDTASLEAFAGGGDAYVTTWYDQSGNGNNATQTTFSDMAKIVSNGSTILVNGKAGFLMTSTTSAYINTTPIVAQSVFSVTKSDAFQTINYIAFQTSGTKGLFNGGSVSNAQGTGVYDGSGYFTLNNESLTQRLDYWNHNGTDYECALNGDSAVSVGTITRLDSIDKLFGRQQFSLFLNGKAQEIIFYATDNSANKSGIETNINTYYNIYP
mgnify:CR=1 FL=1